MATPRICSVEGCGKKHYARSYCTKHYALWRLNGDPNGLGSTKHGAPKAWLDASLGSVTDDCLIWPFTRTKSGYPRLWHGGRMYPAYRLVCEMAHGEPPTPAHQAAHSCGRGRDGCVNPNHLRWATRAENERDKIVHGTVPRGEKNAMAKLTGEDVATIREVAPFATQASLCRHYGISSAQMSRIINGKRW